MKVGQDVMRNARTAGAPIIRRGIAFFASMAIKQGHYDAALEALSLTFVPPPDSAVIRRPGPRPENHNFLMTLNLRTTALAKMDRIEDSVLNLRSVLTEEGPRRRGPKVLPETVI